MGWGQIERGKHKSQGNKNDLPSNFTSLIFKRYSWEIEPFALYIQEVKTLLGNYK